jgi:hypothetical protein
MGDTSTIIRVATTLKKSRLPEKLDGNHPLNFHMDRQSTTKSNIASHHCTTTVRFIPGWTVQ